jgi:HlyD family secretion protein
MLMSCGTKPHPKTASTKTYTVATQNIHDSLHFTGNIQPLHENTLTSPMDAVVESMHFHYGQLIKKNDVIMVLNSTELQKQYNDTLTEYLKAKDSFTIAKAKFVGTKDLWDAGLIAKNNYLSEKSSIATTQMALLQASQKLKEMGEKMDDPNAKSLTLLSLTQFDKISQVFETKRNLIHLRARTEGILLEAPKTGDDKSGRIAVGAQIKAGQVLGLIGDLSGLSIEIDIPEVDIHKIHVGMLAQVEGVAFGGQNLEGKVVAVNAQASSNQNGGLPSFHALVEVKTLTQEQQRWVKVGMSAAITLTTDNQTALVIPIAALQQEKGQAVVKLKNADGTISSRSIITGAAQADQVLVKSGLKEGDVVLYG